MLLQHRLVLFLGALALLAVGAGCNKQPRLAINPEYSWNLVRPQPEWPGEKPEDFLRPAEQEALAAYGRPDAVRVIYDSSRRLVTRVEVDTYFTGKKPKKVEDFEHGYIYYLKGIEVIMHPSGEIEDVPLSDQLKLIYQHGDPDSRTARPNSKQETWAYYTLGRRYQFLEGHIISEESFPPMGRWKKL